MATETLDMRMARTRDEDLVLIAFSKAEDGFEADVVEAARAEVERRGMSASRLECLRQEIREIEHEESAKGDTPLGVGGRILFLIFGATWMAWLATAVLKYQGYDRKFRDAWLWIAYGVGMWAVIAGLFLVMDIMSR